MLGLSLHLRSNRVDLVGGSSTRRASSMVSANSSVSEPVSCVLLPGVDRKQLAENAQKLEAEAAAAHKAAQQLNKEGRYEVGVVTMGARGGGHAPPWHVCIPRTAHTYYHMPLVQC